MNLNLIPGFMLLIMLLAMCCISWYYQNKLKNGDVENKKTIIGLKMEKEWKML